LWEDAATLEAEQSTSNALLLRLLSIETLLKVVSFADGGGLDEFQHLSIEGIFWRLSAAHQRRVMAALGLEPEGKNLEAASALLSRFTEHFVRARYGQFVGPAVTQYDSEGLPLDERWPEAAPAAARPSDETIAVMVNSLFCELRDLSVEMIENKICWDY
jgi:hypothetical protein